MRKIITVLLLFVALFQSSTIVAQDLFKGKDVSSIKVDDLSDNDIAKIKTQMDDNNVTMDELQSMALSKGMDASEFEKLKNRLSLVTINSPTVKKDKKNTTTSDIGSKDDFGRKQDEVINNKVKDSLNSLVFGSELFDNPTLNFEPNLKLATPVNYILGPGDELQISVNGVQEFDAIIPVTIEGKIAIQYVGQISVSGMTIEAATQKIKGAIEKVYSTVKSGQSQVSVSVSGIRTIKVTIIGSKQPGNYSVSSLSTVYNALFLGGGPGKNGSYRNIELLRNNKVYKNIDIYRFLTKGDQSDNVGLKDNDVIRIPAYTNRVTVEGQVKRPGIFEMKKGENFTDLLNFASGFNDLAYTASVNVLQKTGKEFKVTDIQTKQYNTYLPLSGDVFKVSKILDRFENRITIKGAVFRPDAYSFYDGMRISDLIHQAEGLREDAYKNRAVIVRLKPDLTTEVVNVNLTKAIEHNSNEDVVLKKEDVVTIYSILDFKEDYKVTIDGEIKKPGVYDYYEKLTLNDLLIEAGGLAGSASKRVEIARMIKSETIDNDNPSKAILFNLEIEAGNNEQLKNFNLEPFDVVNIRKMAVYDRPEMVQIHGAVAYPGKYVLVNKKEKIYDIVLRAGGLTDIADLEGVKVKRPIKETQIENLENLNLGTKDSIQDKLNEGIKKDLKFSTIPIDWKKIANNQNNSNNITLLPGDEIEVANFNEGVKVIGNVLLNSEIPYKKNRGFGYYINAVGGLSANGWKKRAYIVYPNGKGAVSNQVLLFFRAYPKVIPGSQIVVPEKPEVKKMSTGEWVGIGSVITSLALLIVTAFK